MSKFFVINKNGHCRLCTQPDKKQNMVACDECDRWFHLDCAKLPREPTAEEPFLCVKCTTIKEQIEKLTLETTQVTKIENPSQQDIFKTQYEAMSGILQSIQDMKKEKKCEEEEDESNWTVFLKRPALINLPRFSGSAKEWPKFKKIYDDTTTEGEFSDIENLNRLQQVLVGNAAKSVQPLMLDPENVPIIIRRLEQNFGRPELIYKELLNDILKIRKDHKSIVVDISDALENMVSNLEVIKKVDYLHDPRLVDETVRKLPYGIQVQWTEVTLKNEHSPSLKDLSLWLKPHAATQRLMQIQPQPQERHENRNRVNMHYETKTACLLCKEHHKLIHCSKFKAMNIDTRIQVIKRNKLCMKCLNGNHTMIDCFSKRKCGENGCTGSHNILLHKNNYLKSNSPKGSNPTFIKDSKPATPKEEIGTSNVHQAPKPNIFYQIIPVTLRNGSYKVNTYAFLDPGASLTLLDESIAEELHLEGRSDPLKLKWTQNFSREETNSKRVSLRIKGESEREYTLKGVRTVCDLHLPVQSLDYEQLTKRCPHLRGLPIKSYGNIQPQLLIGLNHSHLLAPFSRRVAGNGDPIAIKTKLGWLIFGNQTHLEIVNPEHVCVIQHQDEMLTVMNKYFSIEDFGVKIPETMPQSTEILRAQEIIDKTLKRKENRYEIGLLWKEDNFQFPESYNNAYKRLRTLENKLKGDASLKKWVSDTIKDYIDKGYARKLTEQEIRDWSDDIYYLPHFVVINKNKQPPKPRLVFDAAAKTHGVSFNSALLTGPDATTSAYGVLARWREGPIASAGDIKEMFNQVGMNEMDQRKQCFLFRDDENQNPDVYIMQVMLFGSTCSPACAQVVKNYNAALYKDIKPKAAEAVVKQHYVDDYIDSFNTIEEASSTIKDVIEIHDNAGFYIRNFVSNNKALLATLPKDRVQQGTVRILEDKDAMDEKILGVFWNTTLDYLSFQLKLNRLDLEIRNEGRKPTMRELLSFIMSIYDPLGLISNLTIHGKMLMQEVHKETSDWDSVISNHLNVQWKHWLKIIQTATNIRIPRWVLSKNYKTFELHTFIDASEYAYTAAMEISWTFNPPAASHFGGVWERLIQIIKNCLYEMLRACKNRKPHLEVLRSALIQAEFILNSRPLTHMPMESFEDEVLTPFHFLIGRAGEYVPPYDPLAGELSRDKWKLVQHYARHFWDRWRKEYLPTLIKRNKWAAKVNPIKKDDIVLITDNNSPRYKWLKGRVISTRAAADGQVRSVEIQTEKGIYTRPSVKVVVLDVRGEDQNEMNKEDTEEYHALHHHNEVPVSKAELRKSRKRHFNPFPKEYIKNPERDVPDEKVDLPIVEKAKLNFNSWGERQKIDVDKVKRMRDMLESTPRPSKKIRFTRAPYWSLVVLMFIYFLGSAIGLQTQGLIAYDCANPEINMTSYSLIDVSSCLPSLKNLSITEIPIQVLQQNTRSSTMVYQCKVIIRRSIRHCGMHSHTSDYERGYSYTVKSFTAEECRNAHLTGSVTLAHDTRIGELKRNSTSRGETLVIGSVWSSSCSGGVYKTPEYTWINALVYFEYEILLYNYMATVDNENDQIILRHGVVCPYSYGKCLDSEDGYSTWDISLNQRCEDTEFEVIFEGRVNKTMNLDIDKKYRQAVYTSMSDLHLFSIRTKGASRICGYKGYGTDHPRIFILETQDYASPFHRKPSNAKGHDIFTYFNSKITLVENYIGQKLDDVYNSVMTEMCKIDKALLETKLTLARLNPTEFVTSIMKRPGFSAVVAGEVLHVIECKPVYVKPFASERCYQELPVKYGNTTMFLTPVTRTLQLRGTEIECTPLLPAKFHFGGRWFTIDGKVRETIPPQILTTDIVTRWKYTPLPNLMESGVYDADSLQKMKAMIYDQGDRRIASNIVHKILSGQSPSKQGFYFDALVSEKLIDNVINKYWTKLVSWSTWLGNLTSTVIGLYMIGRCIKFVVDTLMHGRILYDIYGFGWQLIASFWDSMTSFLSHRNTLKNIKKTTTGHDDNKTNSDSAGSPETAPPLDDEIGSVYPYRGSIYPVISTV